MIRFINDIFHIFPKAKNFDMKTYTSKLMYYFNSTLDSSNKVKPISTYILKRKQDQVDMFDV